MHLRDVIDEVSVAELRSRGSLKWAKPGPDGFGAFVAEMDFGTAQPILDSLDELARRFGFGYMHNRPLLELADACAQWQSARYGWDVSPGNIKVVPDVIKALEIVIENFSRDRSPVILPTPAYMPFFVIPKMLGREIIQVPMVQDRGIFKLDLEGIEDAYRRGGNTLILCNPYNPVGRVFTRSELTALADIVDRHDGRVFADEIHAPLVYSEHRHVPYASINAVAAGHTITATSTSKGWNLPGLMCAQVVLTNPADQKVWDEFNMFVTYGASNPGVVAATAAYRHGAEWLDEVIAYLDSNRKMIGTLLAETLPGVEYTPPQGTYFAWLNFNSLDGSWGSPGDFITSEAKVMVVDGQRCGAPGRGWIRFNFATPQPILAHMIERMAVAVNRAVA